MNRTIQGLCVICFLLLFFGCKDKSGNSGVEANTSASINSTPTPTDTSTVNATMSQGSSSGALVENFVPNQIAVSQFSTCLLKGSTNEVKCFGSNQHGQMASDGITIGDQPSDIGDNLLPVKLGLQTDVSVDTVAATGVSTIAAVLSDGSMKAWGHNAYGQLGIFPTEFSYLLGCYLFSFQGKAVLRST